MKHVAGTPAAFGEKHEQATLVVTDWLSTVQGIDKGCNVPAMCDSLSQRLLLLGPGLDDRDAGFMQRLRNLAREALTWPHLGERQRLAWAAALELDAVPLQDRPASGPKVEVTA